MMNAIILSLWKMAWAWIPFLIVMIACAVYEKRRG